MNEKWKAKEFLKNLKPSYYDNIEIYFLHARELGMPKCYTEVLKKET